MFLLVCGSLRVPRPPPTSRATGGSDGAELGGSGCEFAPSCVCTPHAQSLLYGTESRHIERRSEGRFVSFQVVYGPGGTARPSRSLESPAAVSISPAGRPSPRHTVRRQRCRPKVVNRTTPSSVIVIFVRGEKLNTTVRSHEPG